MRLHYLLLILLLVPISAFAAVDFKNSDFELKLGSDWTQTVLIGAEHLYFSSKQAMVSVKIDSVSKGTKPENFARAAKRAIELGIKREHEENRTGWVTIVDQSVSRLDNGVRATYSGRDSTQRSFRWIGFITDRKFVYLYFETPTRNEPTLELTVDDVLTGFKLRQ